MVDFFIKRTQSKKLKNFFKNTFRTKLGKKVEINDYVFKYIFQLFCFSFIYLPPRHLWKKFCFKKGRGLYVPVAHRLWDSQRIIWEILCCWYHVSLTFWICQFCYLKISNRCTCLVVSEPVRLWQLCYLKFSIRCTCLVESESVWVWQLCYLKFSNRFTFLVASKPVKY